jgi:hypothetical protein
LVETKNPTTPKARRKLAFGIDVERKSGPKRAGRIDASRSAFPTRFQKPAFSFDRDVEKKPENVRREPYRADDVRSITAFAERFDQTFFFARSDRIRAAEFADAFAGHAPSQVARTAVTVFDFSVGGNAKTLGHAFVSLHFRHLEALSSRYKLLLGRKTQNDRQSTP